jgi:hypothetical protein
VTKKIKQVTIYSPPIRTTQGTWTRSNAGKAHTFAKHLAQVFQPHLIANEPEDKETLTQFQETPNQLKPPINRLKRAEVQAAITLTKMYWLLSHKSKLSTVTKSLFTKEYSSQSGPIEFNFGAPLSNRRLYA